jgi:outer membrane protein
MYGILFLAVVILYYLHFTGGKVVKPNSHSAGSGTTTRGIAYINIDSVIFKFDMFFDRRGELVEKQKNAEAEMNSRGKLYEKNARDYQDKISKGLVTRSVAAEMEQQLYQQQQELMSLRDKLQSDLLEEEQVMNRQIVDYITNFLEENKSDYNYNYILGKSFGSVVLYADSGLNITRNVLDALNTRYKAEKK